MTGFFFRTVEVFLSFTMIPLPQLHHNIPIDGNIKNEAFLTAPSSTHTRIGRYERYLSTATVPTRAPKGFGNNGFHSWRIVRQLATSPPVVKTVPEESGETGKTCVIFIVSEFWLMSSNIFLRQLI